MVCRPIKIDLPGGGVATGFACGPAPRVKCACGMTAPFLCDWKVRDETGKMTGTCDVPLCGRCSYTPAGHQGKGLCPTHKAEWFARQR